MLPASLLKTVGAYRWLFVLCAGWTPSAADKAIYDYLFELADADRAGFLSGSAAVPFLNRSGLDRPILKQASQPARARSF